MSESVTPDWLRAVSAVVKGNPTKVRLGIINTPMPNGYKQNGMYVTVRNTGWPSIDGKEFVAAAWQDGAAAAYPELTLTGCDSSGETGTNPPGIAAATIEIRNHLQNLHRYPKP